VVYLRGITLLKVAKEVSNNCNNTTIQIQAFIWISITAQVYTEMWKKCYRKIMQMELSQKVMNKELYATYIQPERTYSGKWLFGYIGSP